MTTHDAASQDDPPDQVGSGPPPAAESRPHPPLASPEGSLDLAHALEHDLVDACQGRLRDIHWFTSDWQRGGSATAHARWSDRGTPRHAIVKLPVGPTELEWSRRLGGGDLPERPVPRTFASGDTLQGYDLGWLVLERIDGVSVAADPAPKHVEALLAAVARFQARAGEQCPPAHPPKPPDWEAMIEDAREVAHGGRIPEPQRWNEALKAFQKLVPDLRRRWLVRPINAWCHGDVHPGNGLMLDDGTCRLIDLGNVHAGHWTEDAVMLERLFWGHDDRLNGLEPVACLGEARRAHGLENGPRSNTIANIRRALTAACVPARISRDSGLQYVHYSLGILEQLTMKLSS
ncbi:MAG: aminoglycoside phosphotransferase family protein [Planctomycetota bacterium]